MELPQRKRLPHQPPEWADDGSIYFITVCCVDRYANALATERASGEIFQSIAFNERRGVWNLHLTLLMPDHLHGFAVLADPNAMKETFTDWKRYLATKLGIRWQRDFFDHRIRNASEYREKWSYVLQNPVRGGLVERTEDWPYLRLGTQ